MQRPPTILVAMSGPNGQSVLRFAGAQPAQRSHPTQVGRLRVRRKEFLGQRGCRLRFFAGQQAEISRAELCRRIFGPQNEQLRSQSQSLGRGCVWGKVAQLSADRFLSRAFVRGEHPPCGERLGFPSDSLGVACGKKGMRQFGKSHDLPQLAFLIFFQPNIPANQRDPRAEKMIQRVRERSAAVLFDDSGRLLPILEPAQSVEPRHERPRVSGGFLFRDKSKHIAMPLLSDQPARCADAGVQRSVIVPLQSFHQYRGNIGQARRVGRDGDAGEENFIVACRGGMRAQLLRRIFETAARLGCDPRVAGAQQSQGGGALFASIVRGFFQESLRTRSGPG